MESGNIWTMWWQGEDNAPEVVKECFESMRRHANGAMLHILDKWSVKEYIELPPVIREKFDAGCITITHLSDIIRVELINKYGGLWIDSTVFLTEDIPGWIFSMDFYSIRNGAGGDYKHMSQERWTGFVIGGKPGNPVCGGVRWLFGEYWKQYDRLVCYALIDFCLNDVYDAVPEAKALIDALPEYKGNVYKEEGIFHKKSWKISKGNPTIAHMRSLLRRIRGLFSLKNIRDWGITINWYSFCSGCLRRSNSRLAYFFARKYNEVISKFLGGREKLQQNRNMVMGEKFKV